MAPRLQFNITMGRSSELYKIARHGLSLIVAIANISFTACATAPNTIQIQDNEKDQQQNEEVVILNGSTPQGLNLSQIGILTVEGTDPRIDLIYKQFKNQAAARGGQYVTDIKIIINEQGKPDQTLACNQAPCPSSTKHNRRLGYTASGTLLRAS